MNSEKSNDDSTQGADFDVDKIIVSLYVKYKSVIAVNSYLYSDNFYLNIKQLDALNFIMSLFHASTYLEQRCSSSGGQNCTIQSLVSSHL